MQPFRSVFLGLAMAALLGTVAVAAAPKIETTPVPAAAKPDFSKIAFMTGSWTCSIMSSRRPGPYTVTSTTTMSPDGYWMVTQSTVHKASWIPNSFKTEDKMTYDTSTNRWVDITTGDGGAYDVTTSPGWNGNAIVWTDAIYPKTNATATNNPTTVTKVSDTKTTATNSFIEPGGRLVTV